jgi:hypothetical protein
VYTAALTAYGKTAATCTIKIAYHVDEILKYFPYLSLICPVGMAYLAG